MAETKSGDLPAARPAYFEAVLATIRTSHSVVSAMNRVLKAHDLTEPQYNVLATLHVARGKPLCLAAIGEGMIQPESNVSRIVDKLVERDLVSRVICPENRRKMDVTLTREGRKVFVRASREVMTLHQRIAAGVEEEQARQVSRFLELIDRGASAS